MMRVATRVSESFENVASRWSVLRRVAGALAAVSVCALAAAQPVQAVLKTEPVTLTTAAPTATGTKYPAQPVTLSYKHRGVFLDGTMRAPWLIDCQFASNTMDPVAFPDTKLADVRLSTGEYAPTEIDLALPCYGPRWVVGRTRAPIGSSAGSVHGRGWFQASQPEVVYYDRPDTDSDSIYILYGGDRYAEFERVQDSEGNWTSTFRGVNGTAGAVTTSIDATSEAGRFAESSALTSFVSLITYHDPLGNTVTFFDSNGTGNTGKYQIWKIMDAEGNLAYVGHPTSASSALSSGYDSSGRIKVAYDAAGRKFTYTYGGSPSRLQSVSVAVSATDSTVVASVDYTYYTSTSANGDTGDLKTATTSTPVSGGTIDATTYYRYWISTTTISSNPLSGESAGPSGSVRFVVGPEGVRRYPSYSSAGDADLVPYADLRLSYESTSSGAKVSKVQSDALTSRWRTISYGTNTITSTSGYDQGWTNRAIVTDLDASNGDAFVRAGVFYFDEVMQPLSSVTLPAAPSGSATSSAWGAKVERDTGGRVVLVGTPASVGSYTHSDGSFAAAGSGSVGLTSRITRLSSGNLVGFASSIGHSSGWSGTVTADAGLGYRTADGSTYPLKELADYTILRPLVENRTRYPIAGGSGETTTSYYTLPSVASTSDQALTIDWVYVFEPIVPTSQHGSGYSTGSAISFTPGGLPRFIRDRGDTYGQLTEITYDTQAYGGTGQIRTVTIDPPTTPPTGFPSGNATPFARTTTYHYDAQGRLTQTDDIDGQLQHHVVYSKLADGRPVRVAASRLTPGGNFASPASFAVSNLNGASEAEGLMAVVSSGSPPSFGDVYGGASHPGTLVNTATSNPMLILSTTSAWEVRSPSLTFYGDDGRRPTSRIAYHTLGSSPGYDTSSVDYDAMGRVKRVTDPTGTFNEMTYDVLGRVTEVDRGVDTAHTKNIASYVYDGGGIGNSNLTQVTKHTGYIQLLPPPGYVAYPDRVTAYLYDDFGRVKAVINPESPHVFVKRDNLGRPTATGFYSGDPSSFASFVSGNPSLDPLSPNSSRLGYRERRYDTLGQLYKQIDAMGSGVSGVTCTTTMLPTDYWYDAQGRVAMEHGRQTIKKTYDSSGSCGCQATSTYQCVMSCDPESLSYEQTTSFFGSGECQAVVLAESHELLDTSRRYSDMTVYAERNPGSSASGPLISPGCTGSFANENARIGVAAHRRDGLHRSVGSVDYGRPRGPSPTGFDCGTALAIGPSTVTSHTAKATFREYDERGFIKRQIDERGGAVEFNRDEYGRPLTVSSALFPSGTVGCQIRFEEYTYDKGRPTTYCASVGEDCDGGKTVTIGYADGPDIYDYPSFPMDVPLNDRNRPISITLANGDGNTDDKFWIANDAIGEPVMYRDEAKILAQAQMTASGRLATLDFRALETASLLNNLPEYELPVSLINYSYDNWGRMLSAEQFDASNVSLGASTWNLTNWGEIASFTHDFRLTDGSGNLYDPFAGSSWSAFKDSLRTDYKWSFVDGSGGAPGDCGGGDANWWRGPRLEQAWMPGTSRVGGLPTLPDFQYERDKAKGRNTAPDPGDPSDPRHLYDIDKWTGRVSGVSLPAMFSTADPWVRYNYYGIYKPSEISLTRPQQDKVIYAPYDSSGSTHLLAMAIIPAPQDDENEGINPWGESTTDRWTRYACSGGPGTDCAPTSITEWQAPADVDTRTSDLPCNCGIATLDVTDPRMNEKRELSCSGLVKETVGPSAPDGGVSLLPGLLTRVDEWMHDGHGNWTSHTRTNLEFNGTTTNGASTVEFNRTRAFGAMSDQPASETEHSVTPPVTLSILHDHRGNLRDDGTYVYQYDHANHLVGVYESAHNPTTHGQLVARYGYDALGRRTSAQYLGNASDLDYAESYVFVYDESWRVSAVIELSAAATSGGSKPVKMTRYLYHAAGFGGGAGGAANGDAPFARIIYDWYAIGGYWTKVDEQHFLTNKDGDIAAIVEPGSGGEPGRLIARVRYTAYGEPRIVEPADFNGDGVVDSSDHDLFMTTVSNYMDLLGSGSSDNERGWQNLLDFDRDGILEIEGTSLDDVMAFCDEYNTRTSGGTLTPNIGEELMGKAGLPLYRGYWFDPVLSQAGHSMYHVRHRVYDASRGRWLQRDPIGFAGGMNLYQYCGNQPDGHTDPDGLLLRQVLAATLVVASPLSLVLGNPMDLAEEAIAGVFGDDAVEGDKALDEVLFGDGGTKEDAEHEQATKKPIAKCYEMVKEEKKKGNKKKAEDIKCLCDKWAAESYVDAQKVAAARYDQAERSAHIAKTVIVAVVSVGAGSSLAGGAAYFAGVEGILEYATNPNASPRDILRAMAWGALDGAIGWGINKGLSFVFSRTVGSTMDFLAGEARNGGRLYGEARLARLGRYLERRGVELHLDSASLPITKRGGFTWKPNVRGKMEFHLRSDATEYEVIHEMMHFRDWRMMGTDKYMKLARDPGYNEAEILAYERLRRSGFWNRLNQSEQNHAAEYYEAVTKRRTMP